MARNSTVALFVLMGGWLLWVGYSLANLEHAVPTGTSGSGRILGKQGPQGRPPQVAPPPMGSGPILHGEAPPREKESGRPAIPVIDLRSQSPQEAIALVNNTAEGNQWMVAFALGEVVGDTYGNDLAKAAEFANALPNSVRTVFYNGLGHTVPWDVDNVQAQISAIDAGIEEPHRKGAYLGLIIRFTVNNGENPAQVVAFAERLAKRLDVDANDGIRIGNQVRFGEDIGAALAIVGDYPETYQMQMAEELGWRAGTDRRLEPTAIIPLVKPLEGIVQARFVHGVCRGGWNPGLPLEAMRPLLENLSSDLRPHCLQAVSFDLAQVGWSGDSLEQAVAGLGKKEWIELVLTQTTEFSGHQTDGWRNPDMQRAHE